MYKAYADLDDYREHCKETVEDDELKKALIKASRQVDTLTFNRIVGRGFDNLSVFQQEIIKEVVCEQAAFNIANSDVLESVLTGYSVNGVSMQFGESWNIRVQKGVAMKRELYSILEQTGLCCQLAR